MTSKDYFPEEMYPLVVCRQCKGTYHRTNDRYDPEKFCNGSMLTLLPRFRKVLNWSSFPETEDSILDKLVCPYCGARYSDWDGKIIIKGEQPIPPAQPEVDDYPDLPAMMPVAGRETIQWSSPHEAKKSINPPARHKQRKFKKVKPDGEAKDIRKLFT